MKNKGSKIILTIVFTGILLFGATFVKAQTSNEEMIKMLQSLIQTLMQMVAQLQAQLQAQLSSQSTATSTCGWCGAACIRKTVDLHCPDVAPPIGYVCKDANGECQMARPGDVTDINIGACTAYYAGGGLNIGENMTKDDCKTKAQDTKDNLRYTVCSNIRAEDSEIITIKWGNEAVEEFSAQCSTFTMHNVCLNNRCMRTMGGGNSQCTSDSQCVTTTCTDSDGGKNNFVKGTVTYNGQTYTDNCITTNTVKEYYCENGQKQEILSTCSNGYSCQEGACVPNTNVSQTQIIKPTSSEIINAGTQYSIEWTLINATSSDIQSGDKIRIYFDYSGKFTDWREVVSNLPITQTSYSWTTPNISCNYCTLRVGVYRPSTGYWVNYANVPIYLKQLTPPSTSSGTCTDSDGGKNYNLKGSVIYNGRVYTDGCLGECPVGYTGYCTPQRPAIIEFYCENGIMKYETHACETGTTCQDGACKLTTPASIRVLSPNGGEKWEMGKTYQIKWSSDGLPLDKKITNIQLSYFYPGTQSPMEAVIASQVDNTGIYNWTVPMSGVMTDVITKSEPSAFRIRVVSTNDEVTAQDYSDSYFAIFPPTPTTTLTCSDLMITYYRQYYFNSCKNGGFDNVCFNKYTGIYQGCWRSGSNDCTINNINANQNISCKIFSDCTDSDGGNNSYIKGTVTYNGQTYTDSCSTSNVLKEYYCANNQVQYYMVICPTGYVCQDGVCKFSTPPTQSQCSDGSTCAWCGNQCEKYESGKQCAAVTPPIGATCTCVNNVCTIQYGGETSLLDILNRLSASLITLMNLLKQ